jgi:hypothetical protein
LRTKKIAIKPYLETIDAYCDTLTNTQLKEVIFSLAKEIPTSQRADFLDKIKTSLPDSGPIKMRKVAPIEKILEDIEALKEDIEERIEAIEDGIYWDDPEAWDNDYDYDEDPDLISEDQIDELASYLGEAENLFLDDRLEDALKVYQALFGLIEAFRESADVSFGDAVDIREARARYCRCIYETVKESEKLHVFAAAMDIDRVSPYEENQNEYNEDYPLLQDVIDASVGEMRHLDTFLPAWRKTLEKKWEKVRTAVLLLEAVHHLEGLEGVSKLARKWKNKQPAGYLYWLDILKKQAELENIIAVSVEGLKALQFGRPRERLARFLIDAAAEVDDPTKLLDGKRECFFSSPNDQNLLDWLAEAARQDKRASELNKAIGFLKSKAAGAPDEQGLYIKCLLMAGRLYDAFGITKGEKSVGWSYGSNAGIVFGAVLSALTDHNEKATTIQALFRGYANQRSIYSNMFAVEDGMDACFHKEIIVGLRKEKLKTTTRDQYLAWAEKIGKSRINHIVSNKYRNAYARAAQVLGSLAETYRVVDRDDKANRLLHHFYYEKYNRFSAFRREAKTVVGASELLKNMDF